VELSPADIRSQSFRAVIRGYDPQQVNAVLHAAAAALESAHAELAAAAQSKAPTDEAIKLTMMSAVRAKEDMMSSAYLEVEAVRNAAQDEAEGLIAAAQRDAESIMSRTKRSADQMVTRAQDEVAALEMRIEQLKATIGRTENLMKGMASGALGDLAYASAMLAEEDADEDTAWTEPQLQVVVSDSEAAADEANNGARGTEDMLPEAVDRLLNQLREIT
jgi:DivIVA domain-containing protein